MARPLLTRKDLAWLFYLYPGRWAARALPEPLLRTAANLAAPLLHPLLAEPRRQLLARLRAANLPPIHASYFSNAFHRALDDLLLEANSARFPNARILNRHHLDAALAPGRGAILLSAHFFPSRAAKRLLAAHGIHSLAVRNLDPPDLHAGRFGTRFLQPRYVRFISRILAPEVAIQDPECALKILAHLRSGGLVECHADTPLSPETIARPFLGRTKSFATGFLRIARAAQAPLLPTFYCGGLHNLTVEFAPPLPPDSPLDPFLHLLEAHIRRHPANWDMWMRW